MVRYSKQKQETIQKFVVFVLVWRDASYTITKRITAKVGQYRHQPTNNDDFNPIINESWLYKRDSDV